ncbi:coiled-coil domain-containing protein 110 isoform X2 [Dendropsophus ebraccatus]
MTSTPKCKDRVNLSSLSEISDRTFIPFLISDKISDPKRTEWVCISRANEECNERHHGSSYKTSEFIASGKHLCSDISSGLLSADCSDLPMNTNKESKSSFNDTSYRTSESIDSPEGPGQPFKDRTLCLSELRGKPSDTEEIESGQLEMTGISLHLSDSSDSAPVTNVSQLKDHSTKAEVPAGHQNNVSHHTRQARNSEYAVDSPSWSNIDTDHKINTLRDENSRCKYVDDTHTAMIKDDGYIFRIQELESYLTESDQRYMQDQRLKSKNASVQMAIKLLHLNEQLLKDENFRYREQISKLKTEKNFLQLRLSKAEQDGEEYIQEIRTITDKCEELLIQRKHLQDERNHLSVEKQFLMKEMEDLRREKKRNSEELALLNVEKDKLVKMVISRKTMLFTYAKEKQELQFKLKKALSENSDLRRKHMP